MNHGICWSDKDPPCAAFVVLGQKDFFSQVFEKPSNRDRQVEPLWRNRSSNAASEGRGPRSETQPQWRGPTVACIKGHSLYEVLVSVQTGRGHNVVLSPRLEHIPQGCPLLVDVQFSQHDMMCHTLTCAIEWLPRSLVQCSASFVEAEQGHAQANIWGKGSVTQWMERICRLSQISGLDYTHTHTHTHSHTHTHRHT